MKILAAVVCMGIVATGVFYSSANGKQPQKPTKEATCKLSPIGSTNQIATAKPPSTPQLAQIQVSPQPNVKPPTVPVARFNATSSNSFGRPAVSQKNMRPASKSTNQNRWKTPAVHGGVFGSQTARTSKLPPNAKEVKTLLRASYLLPKETADVLEKLFTQDKSASIETTIVAKENSPFVTLIVTTDAARQTSTANFLNSLYPKESLDQIQKDFETAQRKVSDAASKVSFEDSSGRPKSEGSKEPVEDLFKKDSPAE